MTPDLAIDIFKSMVVFSLYIIAPFLGVMLVVGLAASLLQSVTSMQEQTLTFIPKLLAMGGLLLLITPWVVRALSEYAITTIMRMATMAH
jgi:flagellar biosynthetic protein FliQ